MGYDYVYDPAPTQCAKGPRPGAKALEQGVVEAFPVTKLGIFACRKVRVAGASTLSFHADGRAVDFGCKGEVNRLLCLALVANADALGVQEVIGTGRRRWDSRSREWHHYGGDDPHDTHVHVSLCRRAGDTLTLATVRAVLGDEMAGVGDEILARVKEIQITQERQNAALTRLEEKVAALEDNSDG